MPGSRTVLAQSGVQNGEWRTYGGDQGHTKDSPLDQINKDNVGSFRSRGAGSRLTTTSRARARRPATRKYLSISTYLNEIHAADGPRRVVHRDLVRPIAAIDARTGKTLWSYDPASTTKAALRARVS